MDSLCLINPTAGVGAGARLAKALEEHGAPSNLRLQVVFSDPVRLDRQIFSLARGKDLVIIAGGDGTVSAVCRGLLQLSEPPPVAIIPLGTGNDIARSLGWLRVWQGGGIAGLWTGVCKGRVETMDVWSCRDDLAFFAYASLGLDAEVVKGFCQGRRWGTATSLGTGRHYLRYLGLGLRHLAAWRSGSGPGRVHLHLSGGGHEESLSLPRPTVFLLANIDSYAGGSRLARSCSWHDGRLEVYVLPTVTAYVSLLLRGRLPRLRRPVATYQTTALEVHTESLLPLQADGEWVGSCPPGSSLSIYLVRGLPVLVPPRSFAVAERTQCRWHARASVSRPVQTISGGLSPRS